VRRTPPLILGGGPAGSAAAITLLRAGIRPLIVERTRDTGDAICGGFLSWRSLESLARLGIAADDLNRARVTRLRLFAGGRCATSPLPHPAIGVSRRRLDACMLAQAEASGARVERGVAVRALEDGHVRLADGAMLTSEAIFLATGKHDVRGSARPGSARGSDPTLGLRVRLAPSPALDRLIGDGIELHLFDRGYAGVVRHEDGSANICLAVHRSRLGDAPSPARWLATLGDECPALGERLAHAQREPSVDAIANVPYGWHARGTTAGLFRLGDQAGVIPSLAGEGMSIAIASGIVAAEHVARGDSAQSYQRRFAQRLTRPLTLAGAIRRLAERPATARWLVSTASVAPSLADLLARLTRISHSPVDVARTDPHIM